MFEGSHHRRNRRDTGPHGALRTLELGATSSPGWPRRATCAPLLARPAIERRRQLRCRSAAHVGIAAQHDGERGVNLDALAQWQMAQTPQIAAAAGTTGRRRPRISDDREPENPSGAGDRPARRTADDRRSCRRPNTKRWVVRRKAEVVAAVNGGLLTIDEVLRTLQSHARGVRLVAARGRSLGHAGPAGHPHPALPRPLRAPAQVLSPALAACAARIRHFEPIGLHLRSPVRRAGERSAHRAV